MYRESKTNGNEKWKEPDFFVRFCLNPHTIWLFAHQYGYFKHWFKIIPSHLDFEKVKKVIETMINDVFSKAANSESKKLLNELISYVHEVKPDLYTSFHEEIAKYVALTRKSEKNSNKRILSSKFIRILSERSED